MNDLEELVALTAAAAARRLDVPPATLRRWANKGLVVTITSVKGRRYVPLREVERLERDGLPYQRRVHRDVPHGTLTGYTAWCCRCGACRAAMRDYQRTRRANAAVLA